jgi:effector-binding domain-containing protein
MISQPATPISTVTRTSVLDSHHRRGFILFTEPNSIGASPLTTTEPKLEQRDEQHYVGIRVKAAIPELPTVIPQLHSEVRSWLGRQDVAPAGPPFIRYYTTDMATKLDIELGWPTARALSSDRRVHAGVLPAGRYAVLLHTGPYDQLVSVTAGLLEWAEANGVVWKMDGAEWGARVEFYLTDPGNEPNPAKWATELAFLTA